MESGTGRALDARLEATSFLNFTQMDGSPGAAQRALGYRDAITHLRSLSRVSLRDNEDKEPLAGQGEPELSERLTP